ncbi:Putative F-box domain-containing protein [Colletotrichum destructivum]|uniref:F-box domain-containing protein n=1 Tax=Colletotrichum destructivum TaxID=34406 RepID=A0AAX4IZI9_9PEZI|nr:Putative F-box domain-containing protein [Colletotrichum destructivum]
MASGAPQTGRVAPPAALNAMPIEILDLILAPLPPIQLWRLRRVSKRFNAILHRRLLTTLHAKADPLPLTLIKDTAPVPLSFIYNLVLAILGEDEGRKLWGKIFLSRDTSPENPHSSWLPATPPPPSSSSLPDPDPSVATVCRQNQLRAYPDLFAPHLRASSPSLANLRRIHFWSILLWYKEWSSVSADAQADAVRKRRLRWAYKQDRNNKRPGDTPAIVEEFTRTYILRHHFDQPPTPAATGEGTRVVVHEFGVGAVLRSAPPGTGALGLRRHHAGQAHRLPDPVSDERKAAARRRVLRNKGAGFREPS